MEMDQISFSHPLATASLLAVAISIARSATKVLPHPRGPINSTELLSPAVVRQQQRPCETAKRSGWVRRGYANRMQKNVSCGMYIKTQMSPENRTDR